MTSTTRLKRQQQLPRPGAVARLWFCVGFMAALWLVVFLYLYWVMFEPFQLAGHAATHVVAVAVFTTAIGLGMAGLGLLVYPLLRGVHRRGLITFD